jgi:hypothetical protein
MEVKGLKTEYNIGEELDVSNAVIYYYRDMDSERYYEVQLKKDMVSGFSTLQAGNFKMTIKYQDATLEIEYIVKGQGGSGENSGQEGQTVQLNANQAKTVLENAIVQMITCAEIRENFTTTAWGETVSGFQITTATKKYYYESQQQRNWTIRESGGLKFYEIQYDVFDEVVEYTKYTVYGAEGILDVREYVYDNLKDYTTFIQGSQTGNIYTLKYRYNTSIGTDEVTFTIQNNQIKTKTTFVSNFNSTTVTEYVYYNYETNTIPAIPSQNWKDGGYLWQ